MDPITLVILTAMVISGVWTVAGRALLKATTGLALTSIFITVLMFRLNAPLAAVFELSVCGGLITVIFVSTISLTKPQTHQEAIAAGKERLKRFWYLPVLVFLTGIFLILAKVSLPVTQATEATHHLDVRTIMWSFRQLDLFGQVALILAGALGVVILFAEKQRNEW